MTQSDLARLREHSERALSPVRDTDPFGLDPAHPPTPAEVLWLLAEIARLRAMVRVNDHYLDRLALCPDHRDKATGTCIVCQAETRTRREVREELTR